MVIQRNFGRITPAVSTSSSAQPANTNNNVSNTSAISVEDSNWNLTFSSENKTNANSPQNKQNQLSVGGEHVLKKLKERYILQHHKSATEASSKSLELLRMNIQPIFDKEIDVVVKKFVQLFFVPAIKNIKENLGENSISDEQQLRGVRCSLLENAKIQYLTYASSSLSRANTPVMEISDSDSSNENTSILHQALKRKRQGAEETVKRERLSLASIPSILQAKLMPSSSGPQMTSSPATVAPLPMFTKHVVWATSNVTEHSLFILDFKASRLLGISDLRDRLSNKHPELIRYPVDEHDRDWLLQQKQISPLNKNGKYLLLVLAEVEQLAEREYKSNPYVKVSDLQGFKIPEFTYKKMQQYFSSLNERSRELMTQAKNLQNNSILSEFLFAATSSIPSCSVAALLQTSEQSTSTGDLSTVRPAPLVKSALSTSHATLSALLSGQGD